MSTLKQCRTVLEDAADAAVAEACIHLFTPCPCVAGGVWWLRDGAAAVCSV